MPRGLECYHGSFHLHFITCSCYHRLPYLAIPARRNELLTDLEDLRLRYDFGTVGVEQISIRSYRGGMNIQINRGGQKPR